MTRKRRKTRSRRERARVVKRTREGARRNRFRPVAFARMSRLFSAAAPLFKGDLVFIGPDGAVMRAERRIQRLGTTLSREV